MDIAIFLLRSSAFTWVSKFLFHLRIVLDLNANAKTSGSQWKMDYTDRTCYKESQRIANQEIRNAQSNVPICVDDCVCL